MRKYETPSGTMSPKTRCTRSTCPGWQSVLRACATLVLTLVMSASVTAAPDDTTAGPDSDTSQAAFEFAFFVFQDFRLTPRLGAVYPLVLVDHFGVYKRREPAASSNRDPTIRVDAEKLYYDGLEITVARNRDEGALTDVWLQHVRISDSRYQLSGGLRVGEPFQKFWRVLWGDAARHPPSTAFYAGGSEVVGNSKLAGHATVTLELSDDDRVTAVDIDYWAD